METVFEVIVELIDLDASLIFESFLVVVYDIQFVLVVLKKHTAVVYQISHVAFEVKHYTSDFLYYLIYGKNLMTHILKLWSAFSTHSYPCGLVQIVYLIHVMIRARICDASCPCNTC